MKPLIVCYLIGVFGLLGATHNAFAATFNIENGDVASLNEAIEIASTNSQDDVINLAKAGLYTLRTPLSNVEADKDRRLTINGAGAHISRSDSLDSPAFTPLVIEKGATLLASRLTISNGVATHGDGGAIFSSGNLGLTDCTLSGNKAEGAGGAIFSNGTLQLIGCTLSGNRAARGGAVHIEDCAALIVNCTLSGNSASESGAGINFIASASSATATLSHCTFNENTAPSGDDVATSSDDPAIATVQFDNTIFNSKNASPNLVAAGKGALISKGHNICVDESGNMQEDGDQPSTDAMLKPLSNNGGPTLTHMFDGDSTALDRGSWGAIPMRDGVITDQRGKVRPQGPTYDVGACEMDNVYAPMVEEGTI